VIIAGSRGITDLAVVYEAIKASGFIITTVVSGTARGVDRLGEEWAAKHSMYGIDVARYPADWDTHGRAAGYIRNTQMADNADALIACWDGASKGTASMIDIAKTKGLRVYVHMHTKE
jgi:cysteine synthase